MFRRFGDLPETPRLSLRVSVLGGVAVLLFAVLFFRLWQLQVLNGSKYLAEANNNRSREYKVIAPRGDILYRNGEVLVDNRTSLALLLTMDKLPADPAKQKAELAELGELAHVSQKKMRRTIREQEEVAAGAPVTLRRDIGHDLVFYVEENQGRFPGVSVQQVFVRNYPEGSRAAHVLGSVGEVTEEELEKPPYEDLEPGETVGKEGVEYTYDRTLRGQPGMTKIQVNSLGEPTPGGQLVSEPPKPGDNLVLTINPKVQAAGEAALAERGLPGAFVTMDIKTGQILGLGSYPTYDPAVLTNPTQAQVNELYRSESAPMVDRAIQGLYPTGSIYKIITALAALENGVVTPSTVVEDNGSIELAGQKFENSEGAINGPISLISALRVSSDVYFYKLGLKMWDDNDLQHWSHELGIGRNPRIDLLGAAEGLLPSKKWRDELFAEGNTERPWSAGDNVQLAVGQGDLQTNPLQMALAYAALGNGGTIVTPHVGMEIQDAAGRALKEFDPEPQRQFKINPTFRSEIMEGLHEAAQAPGGTSAEIFEKFPIEIAGKTGTAERPPHPGNQSWYAALAPFRNPRIVTVLTIEEGGFGAESAAPAVKQIFEAYFAKQLREEGEEGELSH